MMMSAVIDEICASCIAISGIASQSSWRDSSIQGFSISRRFARAASEVSKRVVIVFNMALLFASPSKTGLRWWRGGRNKNPSGAGSGGAADFAIRVIR